VTTDYRTILITGGAGFVGSNLAVWLKTRSPNTHVLVLDNLKRRGSETTLPRLRAHGIAFLHADIRTPEDLRDPGLEETLGGRSIDLLLECSAEPAVLAGYGDGAQYVINTNLVGTINCLELARRHGADILFLSTSRVYPVAALNRLATDETDTRFVLAEAEEQPLPGVSPQGISEQFPLEGARSLYGATKLCSELLLHEYADMYGLRCIINRCGVLTGHWQMGKVDQGVFALWVGRHYFGGRLSYIGWGGQGKQVRDLLHVDDLAELIEVQLRQFDRLAGQTFNVGGGTFSSLSLCETTALCQEITGRRVPIEAVQTNRPADVKLYVTDHTRVTQATGWSPQRSPRQTLQAIYDWMRAHEDQVRHLWVD
jgi:CDP-paratose 2-epimerase